MTLEGLTKAVTRLLELRFLPRFQKSNASYKEVDLEQMAEQFMNLDPALQEVTFDCVIAISKIALQLKLQIFAQNPAIQYETDAKAKKIKDDIRARKEYQELLTYYVDELASRRKEARMARFEQRLGVYAAAMRAIKIEMD